MTTATTSNVYPFSGDAETSEYDEGTVSGEKERDELRPVYVEEIYPLWVAKLMKHVSGIHSMGKGASIDGKKYWMFWLLVMCGYSNTAGLFLYLAGVHEFVAFLLGFAIVPGVMPSCHAEICIFKSPYSNAILSQKKIRKKLKDDATIGALVSSIVMLTVTWVLPLVFFVFPNIDPKKLPLGMLVSYYCFFFMYPLMLVLSFIMGSWQEMVNQHVKETLRRIENVTTTMLGILKDDTLEGSDARKQLGAVYHSEIKVIHSELRHSGTQNSALIFMPVVSIVQLLYLMFGPLDESRAALTGSIVLRAFFIFFSLTNCLMTSVSLQHAARPNILWRKFTEDVLKDPHVCGLAVQKFYNNLKFLNFWLEQNVITFYLFGISIDRSLPGKILGVFTSIVVSVAVVLARITGMV